MATITFHGAAQEVTGSCYLIESDACGKILLECGMHQGGRAVERLQNERFQFDPRSIDAVVLSHGHLDHSGMLPKLVAEGFNGPIYCTKATQDLLKVLLFDAVGLYERDLEKENMWRSRKGKEPIEAVYTKADVIKTLNLLEGSRYRQQVKLGTDAVVTFYDAGHILGSSIVELKLKEQGKEKTLVFSGDLGKRDTPLMNDPECVEHADLVMMEGTYGDRNHRDLVSTVEQFETILRETWQNGGNVMIPSFAIGRTQELLFYLGKLHHEKKLDNWQIFLDSPMAIEVTKIYDRWFELLDCEGLKPLCDPDKTLLKDFLPQLNLSMTPEDSMAINRVKKGAIIIAGSGMCTGGRIQHHFKQRIWESRNTVVFVGFQAFGTLGRKIVDGAEFVRLFRDEFRVNARVETLGGFSAHADQKELVDWISHFKNNPRVLLVHGEAKSLDGLTKKLWEDKNISADSPYLHQSIAF